ncbi:MAG: hypothetical protein ACI81L_001121 [Verrucomicrobiales bacterium]|jgi:hypothetical protein
MADRPIGDDIDQTLRRAITDLATVAPPAPEFDDLVNPVVVTGSPERGPQNRRPVLALAFAAVVAIAGLSFALIGDDQATVELGDETPVGQLWGDYADSTESSAVQRCLAEWITNRDINFRIKGDQFNASSAVSQFFVSRHNAASWTSRHLAALRLAALPDGDSSPKRILIDELEQIQQRFEGLGAEDRVDIAPALNIAGARFDSIFFRDAECPLGAASDRSPLQLQLETYSGENDETKALLDAVRCADAALVLHAAESAIAMPSENTATRLRLAVELAGSVSVAGQDPVLVDFVSDHEAASLDEALLTSRTALLSDSFPKHYVGCPLF